MTDANTSLANPSAPVSHSLPWWRAGTIALLIVLLLAGATSMSMYEQFKAQIGHLQTQLKRVPQVKYIAVLTDLQGQAELLVTLDPQDQALQLQRVGRTTEGREDSLQLWALPEAGRPRSLGLLGGSGKTLRIPVREADLQRVRQLAVSVESKGGVSDEAGPSGALLWRGALLQKAL